MNASGLTPLEFFVVVELDATEKTTPGGIILLDKVQEADKLATQEGTLIAASPHAFTYAEGWPEGSARESASGCCSSATPATSMSVAAGLTAFSTTKIWWRSSTSPPNYERPHDEPDCCTQPHCDNAKRFTVIYADALYVGVAGNVTCLDRDGTSATLHRSCWRADSDQRNQGHEHGDHGKRASSACSFNR
jgi:hypothetical protein